MQSTDVVARPSTERMPFDSAGALKREIGPLREKAFYLAPDLDKLPQWRRTRGNEWTTAPFRAAVLRWLRDFFRARAWPRTWQIDEIASSTRNPLRLSDDLVYLQISITDARGRVASTTISFPNAREDALPAMLYRLGLAEHNIDLAHGDL